MLSFPKTDLKIILAGAGLILCLWLPGYADTDLSLQQQKNQVETRIDREKEQITGFTRKESRMIRELDDIDRRLNQARIRADALTGEIRDLETTMAVIRADTEKLVRQVRENEAYAGNRLNALYRLHMIGRLDMMGPPATLFDFFVTHHAMTQLVRSDFQAIETLNQDLSRLKALDAQLAEHKAAKTKLETEVARQIGIMEQETQKKQAIVQQIRHQKAASQASLAALEESARKLDEKIQILEKQPRASQKGAVFSRQKGRLTLPVTGEIVSRFGPVQSGNYKAFTFQSGIDIKVKRGEPVRSVFRGEVVFAEWLSGYGNLVIIDHGENYYTLYAHLQEVFKKTGDTADTGEVIATVGDTGSINEVSLHFQLRHHGKPVDPMKWFNKGA
jgi:murein hydrolase activator